MSTWEEEAKKKEKLMKERYNNQCAQEHFNGYLSISIQGVLDKISMTLSKVLEMEYKLEQVQNQLEHMDWQLKDQFSHTNWLEDENNAMYLKNKWIEEGDPRLMNHRPYYSVFIPEPKKESTQESNWN